MAPSDPKKGATATAPLREAERLAGVMPRRHAEDAEQCEGIVVERLPHALYRVRLDSNEQVVAHLAGSPQRNFVRLLAGDRVGVARSSRNPTRGRITRRIGN